MRFPGGTRAARVRVIQSGRTRITCRSNSLTSYTSFAGFIVLREFGEHDMGAAGGADADLPRGFTSS